MEQQAAMHSLATRRQQALAAWGSTGDVDVTAVVGMGTCGLAAGAGEALEALAAELARRGLRARLRQVGCAGMCAYEPMLELQQGQGPRLCYGDATAAHVAAICATHFDGAPLRQAFVIGEAVAQPLQAQGTASLALGLVNPVDRQPIPFLRGQRRVVLGHCGLIDPESIDDYLAVGGYVALERALTALSPLELIAEVTQAGLRGRGGGGFPTGLKWDLARRAPSGPKVVICNADEGDPGAFMDRSILEGDPHAVLEGMLLAGYAIGAQLGVIYCRAEYPLAIRRLTVALEQARAYGLLGDRILGTDFCFAIEVKAGAGAFVCGEETALMASLQGERGTPWPRPPYPTESGLWGRPTSVNNVKSLAYVPPIVAMGAGWFRSLGTETSPGTAVFALTGMVNRTGLVEVPMGTTLREIVEQIGGGLSGSGRLKAIQTGGPLGGCLPAEQLDTPVDFDSLRAAGAVMGSGGMIVVDEGTCMVEFAHYFARFTCAESCGKCPPCRIGSRRMLETLERIAGGQGTAADLETLIWLAQGMQQGSLCALGQLAPSPILSTLRHFRAEYAAHIDGWCPAGKCRALIRYEILPELCTGCMVCLRSCPGEAISGQKLQPQVIDPQRCERCGLCMEVCKFDAIVVRSGTTTSATVGPLSIADVCG